MFLFALAFWLDLELVMLRMPQTARGGMAYYEHLDGPYTMGPGPNAGGRITLAHRVTPQLSLGAAATGIWGYLGRDDADRVLQAYTWQLGAVARWTFFDQVPVRGMSARGSLRGELGIAGIVARGDGMELDHARRRYAALALELRYGGRVAFVGSLGTTQPLGATERVVADLRVPELPLGGFEMILGVSIDN